MDSVPPTRRHAYEFLCQSKSESECKETPEVARVLGLPTNTVRRALEDLGAYRLVRRYSQGEGKADLWMVSPEEH
jgi:predicted ArsR family transcriptional regulator